MNEIAVGKKVPDFTLPATGEQKISLNNFKGKNVVLYFYPKDSTPGCTQESCEFRDLHDEFSKHNTVIIGISRDNLKSHEKFKSEQGLTFDLLSDADEELCNLFGVMKDKNMYGKKVRGIERSTFLIDATGKLVQEWRKVTVNGHVDEVLEAVSKLS